MMKSLKGPYLFVRWLRCHRSPPRHRCIQRFIVIELYKMYILWIMLLKWVRVSEAQTPLKGRQRTCNNSGVAGVHRLR